MYHNSVSNAFCYVLFFFFFFVCVCVCVCVCLCVNCFICQRWPMIGLIKVFYSILFRDSKFRNFVM